MYFASFFNLFLFFSNAIYLTKLNKEEKKVAFKFESESTLQRNFLFFSLFPKEKVEKRKEEREEKG